MYFNIEDVAITPCGGNIHFQLELSNQISLLDAVFSEPLIYQLEFNSTHLSNGEEKQFTYESGTCKGIHL